MIEASIASGGMGDVWKAQDSRLLRPVAIKILKDQTPDAAVILVLGAGLLTRTVYNLASVGAGFDKSRLVTFSIMLPDRRRSDHLRADYVC